VGEDFDTGHEARTVARRIGVCIAELGRGGAHEHVAVAKDVGIHAGQRWPDSM
jgi:hypothetical protein